MKTINFWKIDEVEALIKIKSEFNVFSAAMVEMMKVDNFDNFLPSGLRVFSTFFYDNHKLIYENQGNYEKIYFIFLEWMKEEKES